MLRVVLPSYVVAAVKAGPRALTACEKSQELKVKPGCDPGLGQRFIEAFLPGSRQKPVAIFLQAFESNGTSDISPEYLAGIRDNPVLIYELADYMNIATDKLADRIDDLIQKISPGFLQKEATKEYYDRMAATKMSREEFQAIGIHNEGASQGIIHNTNGRKEPRHTRIREIVLEHLNVGTELSTGDNEFLKRHLKFKNETERSEIVELARAKINKENRLAYKLGKLDCIRNKVSGELDQELATWARNEANQNHALKRGFCNEHFQILSTKPATSPLKDRTIRSKPETPNPNGRSEQAESSGKPMQEEVAPAPKPTLTKEEKQNAKFKRFEMPSSGSRLVKQRLVASGIALYAESEASELVSVKIENQIRSPLHAEARLASNSKNIRYYYLGQNEGIVTNFNSIDFLPWCFQHPDHFFAAGASLNEALFNPANGWGKWAIVQTRKWIETNSNSQTLFGERVPWLINGKKGNPPLPPGT